MSAAADGAAAAAAISTAKTALRRKLLDARRRLQADAARDARLCAALLAAAELATARVVAGYVALPGEPDLNAALCELSARGVRVLLPVVQEDGDLQFREWKPGAELVRGRAGTREPAGAQVSLGEADVVLVPAVAADRAGRRLGRGGGCYDRALQRVRPDALVIAVVHEPELLEAVPAEPHDRPVDAVLAGSALIRARAAEPG